MRIIIRRPGDDRDLNMTPEGEFLDPPPASLATRVFRAALIIAVVAAGLALAALALWFALMLIPIAAGAALIAWGAFRWRVWRARRSSLGGERNIFRG
ncbi:hypothetical protein [Limobrevibacterium gyesilva]|uniref:Uncharacterized protein n=1 Tax=Limobrevibacterium gyesilva TaxID=2991712 RepID=A0AA41YMU7_9PROT|nr:hypothetical protein [Limobrevibacterium gyesilva]MCW3476796.1 hypothetical protein [Limobrevibacterium gyesilva]